MVAFIAAHSKLKDEMIKKTYRTYSLKGLQLCLKGKWGKRVEINFRTGIQIDSTAKYTTSDPEIQALMEKCTGFGRDYYIESQTEMDEAAPAPVEEKKVEEAPVPEKEIVSEMKDSRRFRNLVEMKNAMKELGIELDDNATYPKAKAAAAAAGYDFQIKKK